MHVAWTIFLGLSSATALSITLWSGASPTLGTLAAVGTLATVGTHSSSNVSPSVTASRGISAITPPAALRTARIKPAVSSWPDPSTRGYLGTTGLLHLHTPYSHDACDGEGLDADGNPVSWCLQDLREDICDVPHRFYMFTDHRSYMADQDFTDLFHHDASAGDTFLYGDDGRILANAVRCEREGQVWTTYVMVGLEGSHNMPVGLGAHLDNPDYYGVGFGVDEELETQNAEIDDIHAQDGLATLAHAEKADVTIERLLELNLDAMELYSAHNNITNLTETRPFKLLQLEQWIQGAQNAPVSDYVALVMFPELTDVPMAKWDGVNAVRPMPGFFGTDVHENNSLDEAYCSLPPYKALCQLLEPIFPNLVAFLEVGGPVMMADGERMDSYQRMFRWFSNHVLVQAVDPVEIKGALAAGRSFMAFDILGIPEGFDLVMARGDGSFVELGETVPLEAGLELNLTVPRVATRDIRGEEWSEQAVADVTVQAVVKRVDGDGTSEVGSVAGAGTQASFPIFEPGAYRVEVTIQPRYLTAVLGSQQRLAYETYAWVWSNPIYVEETAAAR